MERDTKSMEIAVGVTSKEIKISLVNTELLRNEQSLLLDLLSGLLLTGDLKRVIT